MSYTAGKDWGKTDWLSCSECGSGRVSADVGGDWTPALSVECRECEANGSWYL